MVDQIQSVSYPCILFLIEGKAFLIICHGSVKIIQQIVYFKKLVCKYPCFFIQHDHILQFPDCPSDQFSGTAILFIAGYTINKTCRFLKLSGTAHFTIAFFQFFFLFGNQCCFFDLIYFKGKQIHFSFSCLLIQGILRKLLLQLPVFPVTLFQIIFQFCKLFPCKSIQQLCRFLLA